MSVLIRGMEIPDHCIRCPFMISRDGDDCILQNEEANESFENWEQMKENCPLIEIKTPHGDLIDRDALKPDIFHDWNGYKVPDDDYSEKCIRDAHVVIEAEGET